MKRMTKHKEFRIDHIVTPNIIGLGQKDKLQEISLSLNKIKMMESAIDNKWAPKNLKKKT